MYLLKGKQKNEEDSDSRNRSRHGLRDRGPRVRSWLG